MSQSDSGPSLQKLERDFWSALQVAIAQRMRTHSLHRRSAEQKVLLSIVSPASASLDPQSEISRDLIIQMSERDSGLSSHEATRALVIRNELFLLAKQGFDDLASITELIRRVQGSTDQPLSDLPPTSSSSSSTSSSSSSAPTSSSLPESGKEEDEYETSALALAPLAPSLPMPCAPQQAHSSADTANVMSHPHSYHHQQHPQPLRKPARRTSSTRGVKKKRPRGHSPNYENLRSKRTKLRGEQLIQNLLRTSVTRSGTHVAELTVDVTLKNDEGSDNKDEIYEEEVDSDDQDDLLSL